MEHFLEYRDRVSQLPYNVEAATKLNSSNEIFMENSLQCNPSTPLHTRATSGETSNNFNIGLSSTSVGGSTGNLGLQLNPLPSSESKRAMQEFLSGSMENRRLDYSNRFDNQNNAVPYEDQRGHLFDTDEQQRLQGMDELRNFNYISPPLSGSYESLRLSGRTNFPGQNDTSSQVWSEGVALGIGGSTMSSPGLPWSPTAQHQHHQFESSRLGNMNLGFNFGDNFNPPGCLHGSTLPAPAVPTVLEKFPGFVRCVVDIAPEVVGWVIGRSGTHIKEMKHRSGCGMWVDQKDLKLYITGTDMPRIHIAAGMVADLISKAPVNVSAAGVEDEVVSQMIDCPPHLIGLLIGRGGSTIKRIKEESRANVVINQKMMKVIVSGIPQSVRLAVAMIEDVFTFGKAADEQHHHATAIAAGQHSFPLQGTAQDYMEYGSDILDYGLVGGPGLGSSGTGSFTDNFFRPRSSSMSGLLQRQAYEQIGGSANRIAGSGYGFESSPTSHVLYRDGSNLYEQTQSQFNDMGPPPSMLPDYKSQSLTAKAAITGTRHPNPLAAPWVPNSQRGVIVGTQQQMSSSKSVSSSDIGSPPGPEGSDPMSDWSIFSSALFCLGSEGNEIVNINKNRSDSSQEAHLFRIAGVGNGVQLSQSPSFQQPNNKPPKGLMNASIDEYLENISNGMGMYAHLFHENEIDMAAMRLMGARDFIEIGIPKGPAVKIAYALQEGHSLPISSESITTHQFLSSLGLAKYSSSFEDNQVDLSAMVIMKEQDFAELGVVKGPRLKIMAELQNLFTGLNFTKVQDQSRTNLVPSVSSNISDNSEKCDRSSDKSSDAANSLEEYPEIHQDFQVSTI